MVRARRLLAIPIAALVSLSLVSGARALTCIVYDDVRAAARESVAGEHPLRADSYLIGRVERVEKNGLDLLVLTVSPTHVFGGDHGPVVRLAARSDGPPDPGGWRAGSLWFIAVHEDEEIAGADAVVAPCAPNFEVTDLADVEALVAAASSVDVRVSADASGPASDPARAPLVFAGLTIVIGVASLLAFRRRSNGHGSG